MSAAAGGYVPANAAAVVAVAALVAALVPLAFALGRARRGARARLAGWALTVAALATADALTRGEPAGVRMLAIIAALMVPLKGLVTLETGVALTPRRWLAFCALWPGMRPEAFAAPARGPLPGAARLIARGARCGARGAALLVLAWGVARLTGSPALATLLALPAISLMLHFGLCSLLAGLWRRAGVDVTALFDGPQRSATLDEFWSRRWNRAFSELTARVLYRPLAAVAGRGPALVAAFLTSGLVHEAAISLPAGAGYGGPLAYFALHAGLVTAERRGWSGAGVVAPLLLPLPLLFHPPFLRACIWPLFGG